MTPVPPLAAARRALASGTVTAERLLDRHLAVLEAREPEVRAMVAVTVERARAQAAAADRRLSAGDDSPLLGIPVVVKDLVDVAGLATTAGSQVLRANVAAASAPVWDRLEAAGAVLIGKANTHEFAYGGTTEPTRNPCDLSRMAGGSSGGPAAALAARFCLGAVGTDTAGSIRIPANLCGVAGLKPTRGLVPTQGVIPLSPTLDVVGPMARHVADLLPLLGVLGDLEVSPATPIADFPGLRVGVLEMDGPSDPDARQAVADAEAVFRRIGAHLERVHIPDIANALTANFTIMGFEASAFHRRFEADRDLYTPYVRERLAEAARVSQQQYDDARGFATRLTTQFDEVFGAVDVILVMGVGFPAPPAYDTSILIDGVVRDRDSELCRNTAAANLTGHPAVAVPARRSANLPIGVQLMGPSGGDVSLLAVGSRLQDLLDG